MKSPTQSSASEEAGLDKSDSTRPNRRRRRGRPQGSSQFAESDQVALQKLADTIVRDRRIRPTSVMRDLGYKSSAEIRRLQSKWRARRDPLLAEAQQRLDATPPQTLLDWLVAASAEVSRVARVLTNSPLVHALRKSLDEESRRRIARKEMDVTSSSPIRGWNAEKIGEAIERFDRRQYQSSEGLTADIPDDATLESMPWSLRLHLMSLVLHEMALDARDQEASNDIRSTKAKTKPPSKGNGK